jgi:hypothetical protein
MKLVAKILSVMLLAYVAIGACYGGIVFIIEPDGSGFNMTTDLLENTPFNSYLIPGIVLLIVNGLFPLVLIVLMFLKHKRFSLLLQFQSIILIGWLTVQLLMNSAFFVPHLHYPLYIAAVLMFVCGWALNRLNNSYNKNI